jgi:hypothetical protein
MDPFDPILEIALRLRKALEEELENAQAEPQLISSLNHGRLFESARRRNAFNLRLRAMQDELGEAMAAAARRLGLRGASLAELCRAAPLPGQALAARFAELRGLLRALHEVDVRNGALTQRALRWVRGCIAALAPGSVGYDRRGASSASGPLSTSARVA